MQAVLGVTGLANLLTFIAARVLLPVAWGLSKVLRIPFQDPSPLAKLGFLMSLNQVLYIPLPMWAYVAAPHRFVMVLAVNTLAHLLPFCWLYQERTYAIVAIAGAVIVCIVGLLLAPWLTASATAVLLCALAVALVASSPA